MNLKKTREMLVQARDLHNNRGEFAADANAFDALWRAVDHLCDALERPEQEPQGAPLDPVPPKLTETELDDQIARARAACTCPKSGPNAPTVGMMRRPAIVIGHAPRCPALPIIWGDRNA